MDKAAWFAAGRDEVVPASTRRPGRLEAKDAIRERIALVMIKKQPAVEAGVSKRGLNLVELHRSWD